MCILLAAAGSAAYKYISDWGDGNVRTEVYQQVTSARPFAELNIEETEVAEKYYYNTLAELDRTAYKEMLQGVKAEEQEIYVHADDADQVNRIYRYIMADFPELFWCSGNAKSTGYNQSGPDAYCVFVPEYIYTGTERDTRQQAIEAAASKCLAGMDASASGYEKIKYVYEYIINTTDYNLEAPDNQNIYSVLVNQQSVCAGYAKAFQYLLERAGVFVTYVTGTVQEGQAHAWNLVQCDGEYYYVDSTWGDPVFLNGEEERPDMMNMNYDYLLCNDQELFATHTPDAEVELPACTSTKYNYYVLNGSYYKQYDETTVKNAMFASINNGSSYVDFKFADAKEYQKAKNELTERLMQEGAQYLGQRYNLSSVSYYYQEADETNRITLYWNYENE